MENASKALLISGGVLIGMLVISIGVYLFATYSDAGSSYEQTMQATEIQKFNTNFTKFEGRTDITIHEIITLANFAKQSQEKNGTQTSVYIQGKTELVEYLQANSTLGSVDEKIIENLIKENLTQRFTCQSISYANDGKVNSISFTK